MCVMYMLHRVETYVSRCTVLRTRWCVVMLVVNWGSVYLDLVEVWLVISLPLSDRLYLSLSCGSDRCV